LSSVPLEAWKILGNIELFLFDLMILFHRYIFSNRSVGWNTRET